MLYLLILSSSLLGIIYLTPYLITLLRKYKVVDHPGGRKKHTEPVPRMGGVLIYAAVLLSISAFTPDNSNISLILYSSGIVALCGMLDDIRGLKWYVKYAMQSLSAIIILFYLYPSLGEILIFGIYIPPPFDFILLYFFITGVMNSINMMDGLDGLVGGAGLLLFMLIFILSYINGDSLLMIMSASLTGSLIGFLKFNAYPAKIFLGDTGSLTIGFFLAVSVLMLTGKLMPGNVDIGFGIILLGVPVIDTLKVILLRVMRKQSPFQPDRTHFHHRVQDNNINHKNTVFIVQLYTVACVFLATYYNFYSRSIAFTLFAALSITLVLFNPVYRYLSKATNIKSFLLPYFSSKRLTLELYKKILLPGSSVAIIFIILFLFPSDVKVPLEVVAMMIALCALLLLASFLSFKRYQGLNDIYVLLNLSIFFAFSDLGKPALRYFNAAHFNSYLLVDLAAVFIIGFVGIFMLLRDKLFGGKVSLFSGLDLIMLVFVLFITFIMSILPGNSFAFLGINLVIGFSIYIWYKMVMLMHPAVSRKLYIIAVILPIITLLSTVW